MQNKYIIGDEIIKDKKAIRPPLYEADKPQITATGTELNTVPISVDENVWGNDNTILNKLDENQLADRRLFVRVRHMRRVECSKVYDNIMVEPVMLTHPIIFTISDLSMGGIDIISEYEISIGKILALQIILDNMPYEIKGEVIYCLQSDQIFRAGLKIVQRDKLFIRHLKIFIARISLNSMYGK